jgi:uncharacterized protein
MEKQKKDILTQELMNKSELIRFVLGPERKVYADFAEKLPGRGMWIQANKESLQEAIKTGAFNKACRMDCSNMDDSFIVEVHDLLKKRVLSLLSLSKKTGDLTLGLDRVLDKLKKSKVSMFIVASDSGEDGKHKIEHKISDDVLVIDRFTGAELRDTFGQDTVVVYGVVRKSKLAESISTDYKKLLAFL